MKGCLANGSVVMETVRGCYLLGEILRATKEIHPSAVSFQHIREVVLRGPYAFVKLHENTVFSRSIRQQTASEKPDNKL